MKDIAVGANHFFAYPQSYLGAHQLDANLFGKVAVLYGGTSKEREVSLASGEQIAKALIAKGVDAHLVDAQGNYVQTLIDGQFDRAFIILHGTHGEDGGVQGTLDSLGIPYTGSKTGASALAMDKARSKLVMSALGIPTPKFGLAYTLSQAQVLVEELGLPVAVKPMCEGSSVGAHCVRDLSQLEAAFTDARAYGEVVVEQWKEGADVFVAVLGDEVFPSVQVEVPDGFYTYEMKYQSNKTQYHCPAKHSDELERKVREIAKKAFYSLGCEGWGRMDFIIDKDQNPWVLEVNTIPGMTPSSLVPKSAQKVGLGFEELVMCILATSFTDKQVQEVFEQPKLSQSAR